MYTTQIRSLELQHQDLLAQIEDLTHQAHALTLEKEKYQELQKEATVLLAAITALKDKQPTASASSVLFAEISKLFVTTTVADPQPEPQPEPQSQPEWATEPNTRSVPETLTEQQQEPETVAETDAPLYSYKSASEIEAALADIEELDTHLMAIASILDSCPANEVGGRVWFFVQNIPSDFDDRILGYLPKSIRSEWDKQRTVQEEEAAVAHCEAEQVTTPEIGTEATESTIADTEVSTSETDADPHYFEVGDLVEIPEGKVGHITEIEYDNRAGQRIASVVCPGGTSYLPTNDLKYIGKYQAPQATFEVDDLVQLPDGRKCRVNQVAVIDGSQIIDVILPDGDTGAYKAVSLTKVGRYQEPASEPAFSPAKSKKTKKSKVTPTDILKCQSWSEIRTIAGNDPQIIKDAAVNARTKAEKELIEKLPELIRDYMYETRNFDDLDWLPTYVVQRVRSLFSEPGTPTAA
ncbi:hypothetical protein HW132_28250 [Brasilonema sp. CT11]|nr:hypothetical protein [Brasilonema sp. CT11]